MKSLKLKVSEWTSYNALSRAIIAYIVEINRHIPYTLKNFCKHLVLKLLNKLSTKIIQCKWNHTFGDYFALYCFIKGTMSPISSRGY